MKKQKPCPECRSTMELKKTTLHFEREGFYADVENVSAFICPKCGTRSIPGTLAVKIGDTVEGLFKSAKEASASTEEDIAPAFSGISFHIGQSIRAVLRVSVFNSPAFFCISSSFLNPFFHNPFK